MRISDWSSDVCSSDLDPSGDVNEVALAQISGALCQLAEERHTVPVRIGLPFIAILAVVVRGDGNVGDFIGRIDTANAADDPKFSDVLHGSLLWISVADGFFAAELSHAGQLKMGGSAGVNTRPKAGFRLARIRGEAQFVSVILTRPQHTTQRE